MINERCGCRRLESGASVDATCRRSRTTALQLAVTLGHAEVTQLLLCRGAEVRARDRKGRQAVHLAVAAGRPLLLQLLLDSDPTVLDSPVCPGAEDAVDIHSLDSWSHDHTIVSRKVWIWFYFLVDITSLLIHSCET